MHDKSITTTENNLEKTHSRISKIERKMEDINTDIGFRVKHEVASLKTGLVDEVKTKIKSSLQDEVKTEIKSSYKMR